MPTEYSYFINVNSGLLLDVQDASKAADAMIVQNPKQGTTNPTAPSQIWELESVNYTGVVPSGLGPLYIINKNSGMVLDVANASKAPAARVNQYPKKAITSPHLPNQLWVLQAVESGEGTGPGVNHYYIINVNSGLLLDVDNASKAAGAQVFQYPIHPYRRPYLPNQVWIWEAVVTAPTTGTGTGTGTGKGTGTGTSTGTDKGTGTDETGTDETGTDETGTDETGTDETGTDETGTDETGTDETGTGDSGTDDGNVIRGLKGGLGSGTGR